MQSHTENEEAGSPVRSVIIALGAVYLFLTGQRRSAVVVGLAYAAMDALANMRGSSLARRLVAENVPPAMRRGRRSPRTETAATRRVLFSAGPTSDRTEVEARPRQGAKIAAKEDGAGNDGADNGASSGPLGFFKTFMNRHPNVKAFLQKVGSDNIGMLAAFVSWSLLTSIVPIIVGLIAISGLFLQSPSAQASIVDHLRSATQGSFSVKEIKALVHLSTQHTGVLGLIGFVGVLWGGSNVGGSISTAFQAIFETRGRSFIVEKLIDVGMIFVFTALMLVIVAGSAAGTWITALVKGVAVPGLVEAIGLGISFISAFILFVAIYTVFPNIEPPLKLGNVWKGGAVSGFLFTLLSLIWPIYAHFQNFSKYGQLLSTVLLLTAWIYFFAMITMIGAEVVAFAAIQQAHDEGKDLGPEPEESVPQHKVLRDQPVPN